LLVVVLVFIGTSSLSSYRAAASRESLPTHHWQHIRTRDVW